MCYSSDIREVWAVFYKNCQQWKKIELEWNQKNDTGRNMLSMVKKLGAAQGILSQCEDLARRGYLTDDKFPDADGLPTENNPGGTTSANRRIRTGRGCDWQRRSQWEPAGAAVTPREQWFKCRQDMAWVDNYSVDNHDARWSTGERTPRHQ